MCEEMCSVSPSALHAAGVEERNKSLIRGKTHCYYITPTSLIELLLRVSEFGLWFLFLMENILALYYLLLSSALFPSSLVIIILNVIVVLLNIIRFSLAVNFIFRFTFNLFVP